MVNNTNRYTKTSAIAALGVGLWLISGASQAACLIKTVDGKVKVGAPFMIAPEREVAEYSAHGFIRVACPKDMSSFEQFARQLCDKTKGNNLRSLNPDILIGGSRERACTSVQAGMAEASK
jgi:hypothetical protein